MVGSHYLSRVASGLLERALAASPVRGADGCPPDRQEHPGPVRAVSRESSLSYARRSGGSGTREVRRRGPPGEGAPALPWTRCSESPSCFSPSSAQWDEDRPRRNGRFLLTGSANLLLMHRVSETLAGRATYINLWPMTRGERLGLGAPGIWSELLAAPVAEWLDLIESRPFDSRRLARGGDPGRLSDPGGGARKRRRPCALVRRLPSDVPGAGPPDHGGHRQPRRFPAADARGVPASRHHGQPDGSRPRHPGPAGDGATLPQPAGDLLSARPPGAVLRQSHEAADQDPEALLERSGARTVVERRRSGLRGAPGDPSSSSICWCGGTAGFRPPEVLYWRTTTDLEVDFVVETGGRLLPIEVKVAASPGYSDTRSLRAFREEYPDRFIGGLLLHGGAGDAVDVRPNPCRSLVASCIAPDARRLTRCACKIGVSRIAGQFGALDELERK